MWRARRCCILYHRITVALGPKGSLVAGSLAAIGASVCCVGPLLLLMLGVSGAWVAHLTAWEPYRPIFVGLSLLFLVLAFRKLYLVRRVCTDAASCADDSALKRQRFIFWLVALPLVLLLSFPWYAALFL